MTSALNDPGSQKVADLVETYLREMATQAWGGRHPLEVVRDLHLTRSGKGTVTARESCRPVQSRPLYTPLRGAPALAERMLLAIDALDSRYRRVLELRACGLTTNELGTAMGVSKTSACRLLEGATAAGRMFLMRG